jgi:hypothetical protein
MAHMFRQALGLRNVYVYIIYLVRTQLSLNDSETNTQTRKLNENLLASVPPLTDSGVLHRFPELEGKVVVKDSWLAYFFNPILSGSFTDRKALDEFLEVCRTSTCSLLVAVVFGALTHNFDIGVVAFVLSALILLVLYEMARRQGKLRLASEVIGSFQYGVFLSPRLRRDERKRIYSLTYQLSRVLGEVEHLGPRRTTHERLGLPLSFPTFKLDSK